MRPQQQQRRQQQPEQWMIEIVSSDNRTVTKKGGFRSQEEAKNWMKMNVGKAEYQGALFHITREDPQYRGPQPPTDGAKPSTVRH